MNMSPLATRNSQLFATIQSRRQIMKRFSVTVMMVVALLLATVAPASAGGDKVRGDGGQGSVTQVQVMNPPPFQP
jgi:hypothetical protein